MTMSLAALAVLADRINRRGYRLRVQRGAFVIERWAGGVVFETRDPDHLSAWLA